MGRWLPVVWLLMLLVAGGIWLKHLTQGLILDANLVSMLPAAHEAKWLLDSKENINKKAIRRVTLLLSHEERAKLTAVAIRLQKTLRQSGLITAASKNSQNDGHYWRCASRFLLSAQYKKLLRAGQGDEISKSALGQITSPFAPISRELLQRDPFLLIPNYLGSLHYKLPRAIDGDGLTVWQEADRHWVSLQFSLAQDPFSNKSLYGFVPHLSDLLSSLRSSVRGLAIYKTGAVFYGAQSIESAQAEASLIGAISIVAIITICLLVFRGLRPILLTLLAVGVGVLVGGAGVLLLFGKLHAVALVFGAGLIGVSVDYAFHYCVQRFAGPDDDQMQRPRLWLQAIFKPLSLGMISTVAGFLTLALSPFPGLQQIALFAGLGLLASYLTVLAVFPLLDRQGRRRIWQPLKRLAGGAFTVTGLVIGKLGRIVLAITVLLLAVLGVMNFNVSDDIRTMQSLSANLKEQENQIRTRIGYDGNLQVLLVRGGNFDEVLRAEEKLQPKLQKIVQAGGLSGFLMLSHFLPSQERRSNNQSLLQERLYKPYLAGHLNKLGLPRPSDADCANDNLRPPNAMRNLIVSANRNNQVHLIALQGLKEPATLRKLAATHAGLELVDYAGDLSAVLGQLRLRAFWPLGFACVGIWLLLSWFHGFRPAFRIILVPMIAVVMTPLITSAFGGVFTLFNVMALVLVFVIGLDYAIFLAHSPPSRIAVTALANGLAAFSTIMAFGLLAFSSNYAVHGFGVTVLTGIILAFAMSFLVPRAAKAE